jgi:hypothetical protein
MSHFASAFSSNRRLFLSQNKRLLGEIKIEKCEVERLEDEYLKNKKILDSYDF